MHTPPLSLCADAMHLISDANTALLGLHCDQVSIAMDYHRKAIIKLRELEAQLERKTLPFGAHHV